MCGIWNNNLHTSSFTTECDSFHSQQIFLLCPYATCFALIQKGTCQCSPLKYEEIPVNVKAVNFRPVLKCNILCAKVH